MDSKWPFIFITIVLLFITGWLISTLERTKVMNHWDKRRCELPVMITGRFFKPDSDPRSPSDFSTDNFEFCMKSFVDSFLSLFMAPINALLSKQMNITSSATTLLNSVRDVAQRIYSAFTSYLSSFFQKFNRSVFEMSRIVQYIRMAIQRIIGIAMSAIYMGITVFRGIINSIQAIIRVVLIICAIMLAIIIILWFILFPVIPIILATLTAIVAVVTAFSFVIKSSLASEAESKRGGFCFSEETMIWIKHPGGSNELKFVKDIQVGDELGFNSGTVTAVLHMSGKNIDLYDILGINVSGSHLVQGEDNSWNEVKNDKRSIKTNKSSSTLYCFNTTSNTIPVYTENQNKNVLYFRDWEEIKNSDEKGQMIWNYMILRELNKNKSKMDWKNDITRLSETPLIGQNSLIKIKNGFVPILSIKLGDKVVNREGKECEVLGIIYGEIEDGEEGEGRWSTELYEWMDGLWRKSNMKILKGKNKIKGMYLIIEGGEIIIRDEEEKERIVRDFTEIGYDNIHKTYSFVSSRLRITE
jgi:hypothetical protein